MTFFSSTIIGAWVLLTIYDIIRQIIPKYRQSALYFIINLFVTVGVCFVVYLLERGIERLVIGA